MNAQRFAVECGFSFLDAAGKHVSIERAEPALFTREEADRLAAACREKNRRGGYYHGPVLIPEGRLLEQRVAFARAGWGYRKAER